MNELQFQIDQLRKDKIIYGIEAVAFSVTTLLAYEVLLRSFDVDLGWLALLVSIGYAAYALGGNWFRLQKIRRLEKELWKVS